MACMQCKFNELNRQWLDTGGWWVFFFVGLKLTFSKKMSLPFGCSRGSWWLGPSRTIIWVIACRVVSTFPSWHGF